MKKTSRTRPVETKTDTPAMTEAIRSIQSWGYRPVRPTAHQLKIGDTSFYPEKGTIVVDGKKQEPEKGLPALLALLNKKYGARQQIENNIDHATIAQIVIPELFLDN
jgi:hypothetical protein